jgi:hypothetical protein
MLNWREEIVKTLRAPPVVLRALVDGFDDDRLRRRPAPGGVGHHRGRQPPGRLCRYTSLSGGLGVVLLVGAWRQPGEPDRAGQQQ